MAVDLLSDSSLRAFEERAFEDPVGLLKESGALLMGDFVLASGKRSDYYFDSKKLTLHPKGAFLVVQNIVEKLNLERIQHVGGTAYGAIPIAAHVTLYSHLRGGPPIYSFYHRRKSDAKTHGTEAEAEGQFPPKDKPVAILEDVVTSGDSLLYAIGKAEDDGYNVTHAMTLVDRNEGGREAIEAKGYHFWSLFQVERKDDGGIEFVYNGR